MKINVNKTLLKNYIEQKELNILVANIYNSYLEEYRNDLTINVVSKFSNSDKPIYNALLDVLEIDPDDYEFQRLAKDYKISDIQELNKETFLENPYYKNIKIKNKKFKKWTLDYFSYKPYELFLFDELEIHKKDFYKEINKFGYFKSEFKFIEVKEGDTTWMSITPHEINTMKNDIEKVKGNVLILGLGLGYFPYMAALKDEVTSITIIEKDPDVIDLFKQELLPQFNTDKIKIINEDALVFLKNNNENFDYIYCDLYHNANDGLPLYIKVKQFESKFSKSTFLYWIETSILALLRRYVILIFEENLNGYSEINYRKARNIHDRIINEIYYNYKNLTLTNREQLESLLEDSSLKELTKVLKIY